MTRTQPSDIQGRRAGARPRFPNHDGDSPSPPLDHRDAPRFDVAPMGSDESNPEPAPGHGPDRDPRGLSERAEAMFGADDPEEMRQARISRRAAEREREAQQDAMARPNPRSRPQGNDPRNNGRSRPSQGPASYAGSSTRTRPTDPGLAAAMAAEDRARQEYAQEHGESSIRPNPRSRPNGRARPQRPQGRNGPSTYPRDREAQCPYMGYSSDSDGSDPYAGPAGTFVGRCSRFEDDGEYYGEEYAGMHPDDEVLYDGVMSGDRYGGHGGRGRRGYGGHGHGHGYGGGRDRYYY